MHDFTVLAHTTLNNVNDGHVITMKYDSLTTQQISPRVARYDDGIQLLPCDSFGFLGFRETVHYPGSMEATAIPIV
jgi:hypothetical protein